MAKEIKMKAGLRTEQGSAVARRLRRKGILPAVVKRLSGASDLIEFDAHAFENAMRHHSGDNLLVTLEMGGQEVSALLRELQHNVLTDKPTHADFGEVSLTETVRVSILIRLHGEADGVRNAEGILEQPLRQIEVECLPTDLIETIDVDVTALKLGESITVGDLKLDARYTVLTQTDVPLATVVAPEESDDEEGAAEGAEPVVIAKKKDEGADSPAAGDKKASHKK